MSSSEREKRKPGKVWEAVMNWSDTGSSRPSRQRFHAYSNGQERPITTRASSNPRRERTSTADSAPQAPRRVDYELRDTREIGKRATVIEALEEKLARLERLLPETTAKLTAVATKADSIERLKIKVVDLDELVQGKMAEGSADTGSSRSPRKSRDVGFLTGKVIELNQLLQEKTDQLSDVEHIAHERIARKHEEITRLEAEVAQLNRLLREKTAGHSNAERTVHERIGKRKMESERLEAGVARLKHLQEQAAKMSSADDAENHQEEEVNRNLSLPSDVFNLTGQIDYVTEPAVSGFWRVYKGRWTEKATNAVRPPIAVKVISLPPLMERQQNKQLKHIKRGLELWSKINHKNIMPLLGIVYINAATNIPAFISPWMENGNAKQFCIHNPSFPPLLILYDVIQGLHHLHTYEPQIVHGDIRADNVLINDRYEARLCDFGLSRVLIDSTLWRTTATQTGGSLRWMSPELMTGEECTPTKESDIYAYAMTCYEILSGDIPYKSVTREMTVLYNVLLKGQRPERVESCDSDYMWDIIIRCWARKPEDRPRNTEVLEFLHPRVNSLARDFIKFDA